MSDFKDAAFGAGHDHIFLGVGHEKNERKTWAVIALCSAMMLIEIVGGSMFGSLALVADGLHMSTHAGAMLIAALAYTYARKHASDTRFVFGTGKLGDLAGFTSAIVLAMIAVLIGYEAVSRFLSPVSIHFGEAIPIAVVGLLVNLASVWLLSGGDHGHSHGHSHGHGHGHGHDDHAHEDGSAEDFRPIRRVCRFHLRGWRATRFPHYASDGRFTTGCFCRFRYDDAARWDAAGIRDGGPWRAIWNRRKIFLSRTPSRPSCGCRTASTKSNSKNMNHHDDAHEAATRDHNIRSAYIHVMADAAVSVLAIIGLVLARAFGWLWMDPLAGVIGALVIANWSYGLMRDTGAILLDMNPDRRMAENVRHAIEDRGDKVVDLHVWRVGPGHMSAVVSVATDETQRDSRFYHAVLRRFKGLSHVTVEVQPLQSAA